jgi:lysophosphatidate acyltransferase
MTYSFICGNKISHVDDVFLKEQIPTTTTIPYFYKSKGITLQMWSMFAIITIYATRAILLYIAVSTIGAALVAVYQESKIWKAKGIPSLSLIGQIKVFLFNMSWMIGCLIGAVLILIKHMLTLGKSDIANDSNSIVEDTVAKLCIKVFVGNVQIIGREHLPPINVKPAPVYIANHASQIDLGVVYYLNRRFKWISKLAVLYVPGVGLVMYLSKHVFIDRKKGRNEKSVSNLFEQSRIAIQNGLPMFFFPQGTRRIIERLPAKDGAFIVAQTNHSTLVPISIEIPPNAWNSYYPFNLLLLGRKGNTASIPTVKITIHPPIPSSPSSNSTNEKEDRERLKSQCMEQIYSALPNYNDAMNSKDK